MRLINESDAPVTRDDIAAYEHMDDVFDDLYVKAEINHRSRKGDSVSTMPRMVRQDRPLNSWGV